MSQGKKVGVDTAVTGDIAAGHADRQGGGSARSQAVAADGARCGAAAAWAYMVCCADDTLYAGWTNDLAKRMAAHNEGRGAKYTRGRRPVRLVYAQGFETKNEAMAREAALKRLPRAEKLALAAGWTDGGE